MRDEWYTNFIDEEELKYIEKNRLKRRRCVLTYLPTPEYGTTYGLVEGGIIRSCEKSQSSPRIKKRVSFHESSESLGKEDCHDRDTEWVGKICDNDVCTMNICE